MSHFVTNFGYPPPPSPYPGDVIFELPLSNPFEASVLDLYPIWFSDVFRRYISDLVKKINKYF